MATERALNARAVEMRSPEAAHQEIEAAARDAVAAANASEPVREGAYRVELQFTNSLVPEIAVAFPSIERPAADTVRFSVPAMPDAYRLIRVLYRFIDPK